ncbi:MAG TPA: NAD(P)-dependent oxidoreductase [bacterium]|nr:NAD(P)-dependent oxidoreductase [bacterium]
MGRILVTGASGFVGSCVARRLLERGHQVAALSRGASPRRLEGLGPGLTLLRGDLALPAALEPALAAFKPDAVVHAAWGAVQAGARDDPAQAENVGQARALMALAAGLGARHFVGLGSQAEYGPREGPVAEDTPLAPATRYGQAKVQAAQALAEGARRDGLAFSWLRLYACYGPGDDPRWVLQAVIRGLLRGERPRLTACEQRWDYLYGMDAASAVAAVLERGAAGTFNLGSGRAEALRRTVERVRDLIDPSLPVEFGALPYPPGQPMHLQADIGRLTTATGWKPETPLDLGLARTIDAVKRETAA